MSWFNANSGAIIGVVGVFAFLLIFVLVGIICWYTYLLRQILKSTNRPEIVIYLRFYTDNQNVPETYSTTELCLKNVGYGVARNIKFGGSLGFIPADGVPLHKITFLKYGVGALLPENELCEIISSTNEHFYLYENQRSVTDVDIIYENSNGIEYSDTFTLDFNYSNHPQYRDT
ncbi:hypothetical protein F4212_09465 [Candidatus Poribacteria bacterium]|nr:hypothetical protein [Candidatus Poribacteria bacterium]